MVEKTVKKIIQNDIIHEDPEDIAIICLMTNLLM